MDFAGLPARTLTKRELLDLVDAIAQTPDLWQHLVSTGDGERHYESLYRDEHVDVWVLCWTSRGDTGWHDHDISSGAVRVVAGAINECNPRMGGEPIVTVIPAGQSFCFGPDHIHRLTGEGDGGVSIHAYSPPLWRLGQYAISADGVLRRVPVSYADELRPMPVGA